MDSPCVNDTTQRLSALGNPYRPLLRLSALKALIPFSEAS
jgi:hypothetical protein